MDEKELAKQLLEYLRRITIALETIADETAGQVILNDGED